MLLISFLSLLAPSQAYADPIACVPPTVTASQPSPDQTNVPLNATIQMVVRDNCNTSLDFVVDVELRKGEEIVRTTTLRRDVNEEVSLIHFGASALYEPNTEYHVVVYFDEVVVIPFTTGENLVSDVVGEVDIAEIQGSWFRDDSGFKSVNFTVDVASIKDPDQLGMLELFDANNTLRVIDVVPVDAEQSIQSMYGDLLLNDHKDVCVAVRQLDGLRRTVHTTDAVCPEITKVGCSSLGHIGLVSTLGWIPLLPLLRRRRD